MMPCSGCMARCTRSGPNADSPTQVCKDFVCALSALGPQMVITPDPNTFSLAQPAGCHTATTCAIVTCLQAWQYRSCNRCGPRRPAQDCQYQRTETILCSLYWRSGEPKHAHRFCCVPPSQIKFTINKSNYNLSRSLPRGESKHTLLQCLRIHFEHLFIFYIHWPHQTSYHSANDFSGECGACLATTCTFLYPSIEN